MHISDNQLALICLICVSLIPSLDEELALAWCCLILEEELFPSGSTHDDDSDYSLEQQDEAGPRDDNGCSDKIIQGGHETSRIASSVGAAAVESDSKINSDDEILRAALLGYLRDTGLFVVLCAYHRYNKVSSEGFFQIFCITLVLF